MDEVIFRSAQKLENLQVKLNLMSASTKDFLTEHAKQTKSNIVELWNSPYSMQLRYNTKEFWHYLGSVYYSLKHQILVYPQMIYGKLSRVFFRKWTTRDIYFLSAGFIIGTVCGMIIVVTFKRKQSAIRFMRAIQCTNFLGIESACVMENAIAPGDCTENDVLIDVSAGSIQLIDVKLCEGYGRKIRNILRRLYFKKSNEIPVTLGRDCTGIVSDIGENVKRLEIGDHVWLTVPFWFDGTLCQTLVINENYVSRKPKNLNFEQACSLPYSGSLALYALKEAQISPENIDTKRILVIGGCTPVGLILIQILQNWGCPDITITSYRRAVPVGRALGISKIIISPEIHQIDDDEIKNRLNAFLKELELLEKFDVVFVTRDTGLAPKKFRNCCKEDTGTLISTLPKTIPIESYSFFEMVLFKSFLRLKYIFEKIFGISLIDYNEAHMCYGILDELAEMVENGYLQTVVDKILQPENIEIALHHIQSHESIGSTVITFR